MASPPAWLSPDALEIWARLEPALPAGADPDTFAVYCSELANYQQAQRLLNQTGPLLRTQTGNHVPSPLVRVKQGSAQVLRSLHRDLGLADSDAELPVPTRPVRFRNRSAMEKTLSGLRAGGRLERADEATVALTRTLAEALDKVDAEMYPAQIASLARSQLAALRLLRGSPENDADSGLADILAAAMQGPMGDAPES
jgi:P27 family predicted phage terminase small subunit